MTTGVGTVTAQTALGGRLHSSLGECARVESRVSRPRSGWCVGLRVFRFATGMRTQFHYDRTHNLSRLGKNSSYL